jgi:hypothetical protein
MPGPDGIPSSAYKQLGNLAVDLLHGVFEALSGRDAEDMLVEAYKGMTLSETHAFNQSILCCLPKKPSGQNDSVGQYYHPGATRPLNISNVESRLLASAARLAWEPTLERWISAMQRGFLKGRVMLHNILDIDYESMRVSLKSKAGSLLLFDFRAAFPSVSHDFLMKCLTYLGLPEAVMNFIHIMYNNNMCTIRIQGEDFPGFFLAGGVRQGCPLSPLLFAVCVDILLRMLVHEIPDICVKAFADDVGCVVSDWWSQGPILQRIFRDFGDISNLHLNIDKTFCIPLWPGGRKEVQDNVSDHIPQWSQIHVDDKGTYLGFVIGPGGVGLSWDKPLKKFQHRVAKWAVLGKGMQYGALTYNVFALSTLLFVAQLEQVPKHVIAAERAHVTKMFPGPGHWIEPQDLWYCKELYGAAKSAQPLSVLASASQLRVAALGCHFGRKQIHGRHLRRLGTDNICERVHLLRRCMVESHHMERLAYYKAWYENNYCLNLVNKVQEMHRMGINATDVFQDIICKNLSDFDDDDVMNIRMKFQRSVVIAIKNAIKPDACQRIRYKLARWHNIPYGLTGLPGTYSRSIHRRMLELARRVPPRVHAAVLHTLFNGWVTHRRLQRRKWPTNKCVFKCNELGEAEDSLEHYCRCDVVHKVARHIFHISYPDEQGLDLWALNSKFVDNPENMLSVAMLQYGVYNAFNTLRYSPVGSSQQAFHCIVQHCKQGAFGHIPCMTHLDSRWKQTMKYMI